MSEKVIEAKLDALVAIQRGRIEPGARRVVDKYAALLASLEIVQEHCDVREDMEFKLPILPDVELLMRHCLRRHFMVEGMD